MHDGMMEDAVVVTTVAGNWLCTTTTYAVGTTYTSYNRYSTVINANP